MIELKLNGFTVDICYYHKIYYYDIITLLT